MNYLKIFAHDDSPFLSFGKIALFIALININLGNLLYFGDPTARITSCFLGMVLIASIIRENWGSPKVLKKYSLAALSFACMPLFLTSKEAGFIGLVCALGCLMLLGTKEENQGQIHVFIAASALTALFDYGYSHNTLIWYGVKEANHLMMNLIGALTGQEMLFGHHASGFFILIPFILYVFVLVVYSVAGGKKITDALPASFSFLLLIPTSLTFYLLGQQVIFSRIQLNIYQTSFLLTPFETHWLAFLLFLLPLYFINKRLIPLNFHPNRSTNNKKNPRWLTPIFLLLFSLVIWNRWVILHFSPPHHKKILIYDNLDWSVPEFGYYGERSGGMFGNLPDFLSSLGYTVQVDSIINEEKLQTSDVLIIINLIEGFDKPVREAIQHYVSKGGNLLVMGDHTGFGFIREPFNDLLEPMHISFRFDSAISFAPSWQDCMEVRPHLITEHVETENDVQIGTGASLAARYPANPILIGKRAFSDAGNKANNQNGFLGDFHYQKSEWLGDIVLAAETRFGRGKVLVFGDTSSVQNGALVYNRQFVQDIFQWLTEDILPQKYIQFILWVLFLLFLGLSWYGHPLTVALWLVFSLYLFQVPANFFPQPDYPPGEDKTQVAYLDNSHGELFDLNGWQKNSIDGLAYNLMRNLYAPFITNRLDGNLLNNSKMWVFINPTKAFSPEEKKALQNFMQKGGLILCTANWSIQEATTSLWDGLSFANLPLGPVKERYKDYEVQFQDAWAVQIKEEAKKRTTVLLEKETYPLVVFQRYGRGGMLLIPDDRFLLNQNLENVNNFFNEGNIMFLRDTLKKISKG